MFERIYQHSWISYPKEVRERLTKIFFIPTSGVAEIKDQEVLSDGKTNTDLLVITKDKLISYVGESADFPTLWEKTLAKVDLELHPLPTPPEPVEFPPYCDTCTSTKGRHKAICPKFK